MGVREYGSDDEDLRYAAECQRLAVLSGGFGPSPKHSYSILGRQYLVAASSVVVLVAIVIRGI
jgi:hypothetical protein